MTRCESQQSPESVKAHLQIAMGTQPNWLRRLWRKVCGEKHRDIRYFVSYDYHWKEYANSRPQPAMGHCVLDVTDGITTWEKVCAVQLWISKSISEQENIPIVIAVRINNFIPISEQL